MKQRNDTTKILMKYFIFFSLIQGGVDFSGCETQDDGSCCVMREEEVTTLQKEPLLGPDHLISF